MSKITSVENVVVLAPVMVAVKEIQKNVLQKKPLKKVAIIVVFVILFR